MAKKTKTNGATLTIPAIVIDAKTLRMMAEQDHDRIEEHFEGLNAHMSKVPTVDAMLQNEKYLAYLTKRVQKLVVEDLMSIFEGSDMVTKEINALFKADLKAGQAEAKRIKTEKETAFKTQDPELIETLSISRYDAALVKRFMERNNVQFAVKSGTMTK